ncbi:MAG: DUF3373 family protein [Desulfobacteraceae bacterium]|nr:DUF3373 family protein [Desulfobacteraceae bacterium]MBU4054006.1 DUF3373 family protein [Pseudomonadota bacterium]
MKKKTRLKSMFLCTGAAFVLLCFFPLSGFAADDVQSLNDEIKILKDQLESVQKKLEKIESADSKKESKMEEMDDRLNKAEIHTATDKIALGVELRTRADSIHYQDTRMAPEPLLSYFFIPFNPEGGGGFNGAPLDAIRMGMAGIGQSPLVVPDKVDVDNDVIFTNKFRLNLSSKFNNQLSFGGRLAAYKVFGDSTGVKFNQGSLGDVTFDGNTSSLPHGDVIRLERAYFNYKTDWATVPVNFSLGRRPSTEGPPLEYANYSLEGGSPMATIINWQFDGASLSFGLEDQTGIPGADFKLCYGVGYEGDWGNSSSLSSLQPSVDDVHLFGFITTLFDNDATSVVLNYARAWDITDGFTGLTVMPFIVSKNDANMDGTPEYYFSQNSGGFISRLEPMTNLGDWDAATLVLRSNLADRLADIDVFMAGSWTHTDPSRISNNPFYEIMGMGLLSSNGELEARNGYNIYTGAIFPMPMDAKLGLEYNWGSKYWFNFTGAEDSLVGSKLAVRGSAYEAYYLQPIFKNNFFVSLGGRIYDYQYTGSGNPLGKPVKISDVNSLDALNPVVDNAWDAYLSLTFRY